jgi:hypothetical protein
MDLSLGISESKGVFIKENNFKNRKEKRTVIP